MICEDLEDLISLSYFKFLENTKLLESFLHFLFKRDCGNEKSFTQNILFC